MQFSTLFPSYFPSLEYFWYLMQANHVILTDHFQYTKRSFLTRSAKLNQDDPVLSIPVEHTKTLPKIFEVQILKEEHWRKKHYLNIYHHFHDEPYAYFYMPQIKELIYTRTLNLSTYVFNLLKKQLEWLHLNISLSRASDLKYHSDHFKSIVEWSKITKSNTYLYPDQVFENRWLNREDFLKADILLKPLFPFPEHHILKSNRQLMLLAFLFQYGPEAGIILRQYLTK